MLNDDWKFKKSIFIVAKSDQIEWYKFVTKSSKFTSIFWLFFKKVDVYQALHRKSSNTLVQNLESVTDTLTPGPFWGGLEVQILLFEPLILDIWRVFLKQKASKCHFQGPEGIIQLCIRLVREGQIHLLLLPLPK